MAAGDGFGEFTAGGAAVDGGTAGRACGGAPEAGGPCAGGDPDRPSESATEFEPTPGTVTSMSEADARGSPAGAEPEVSFMSPEGGLVALAAGWLEPAPGDDCDRIGVNRAGA
jgi:hypothetical protein